MAIDGTYNVEVETPVGKQSAKLILKADGGSLSGSFDNPILGVHEFSDGTVDGDSIAWAMVLDSPVGKMNLEYHGTVSGDEIIGKVKAGSFGTAEFKGTRA